MYKLKSARTKAYEMAAEYSYGQPALFLVHSIYINMFCWCAASIWYQIQLDYNKDACSKHLRAAEISWKLHDPVTVLCQAYKRRSKTISVAERRWRSGRAKIWREIDRGYMSVEDERIRRQIRERAMKASSIWRGSIVTAMRRLLESIAGVQN